MEIVEDLSADEVVEVLAAKYDRYDYPQLDRSIIEMLVNLAEQHDIRFYRKVKM